MMKLKAMAWTAVSILFLLSLAAVQPSSQQRRLPDIDVPVAANHGPALVSIFVSHTGPEMKRSLICAIFGDGQVIRSLNEVDGGGPFIVSHLPEAKIARMKNALQGFSKLSPQESLLYSRPEQGNTVIVFIDKDGLPHSMESMHERIEAAGPFIVTDDLRPEVPRERNHIDASMEYAEFRAKWAAVRTYSLYVARMGDDPVQVNDPKITFEKLAAGKQ